MPLTQTLAQLRSATRRLTDTEGTDALERHPNADVNDYVNRGLAALHRILVRSRGDQRYLTQGTITTVAGTSSYALSSVASTMMHVISVDITLDGRKVWLDAFQPEEYALLSDTNNSSDGRPTAYAIRGDNLVLLPVPTAVYSGSLWYVPHVVTMTADADVFDTIDRLDDYVIHYAGLFIAMKDKAWELAALLKANLGEMRTDIEAIARSRDPNSSGRIVDESLHTRTGHSAIRLRGWR